MTRHERIHFNLKINAARLNAPSAKCAVCGKRERP